MFHEGFQSKPTFLDLAGTTKEEQTKMALNMLEEQVLNKGPDTIAMIQLESVVGGGGIVIPAKEYMQGVHDAMCNKYNIILHCNEAMEGFGYIGEFFGFQLYNGVYSQHCHSSQGTHSSSLASFM